MTSFLFLMAVLGLLAFAPAAMVFASDLRRRPNRCSKCDYALDGLTNDAPCPECGQEKRDSTPESTFSRHSVRCSITCAVVFSACWVANILLWAIQRPDVILLVSFAGAITPLVTVVCAWAFTVFFVPIQNGTRASAMSATLPIAGGLLSVAVTLVDMSDVSNDFQGITLTLGCILTVPLLGWVSLFFALVWLWVVAAHARS